MKEVTGVQIPVVASQAWLGPEHAHSIALSNHTSSNNTLSPTPSSTVHSRDSQGSSMKGKNVIIKAPILGSPLFAFEAQFSPNSFPTNNRSPFNELTNSPLCPQRGLLKRVAGAQGKKTQNFNIPLLPVVCSLSCTSVFSLMDISCNYQKNNNNNNFITNKSRSLPVGQE